jgi:hypothetical protein
MLLDSARDYELSLIDGLREGFTLSVGDGVITASNSKSGKVTIADQILCREIREFVASKLSDRARQKASQVVATIGAFQLGMNAQQIRELSSHTA